MKTHARQELQNTSNGQQRQENTTWSVQLKQTSEEAHATTNGKEAHTTNINICHIDY